MTPNTILIWRLSNRSQQIAEHSPLAGHFHTVSGPVQMRFEIANMKNFDEPNASAMVTLPAVLALHGLQQVFSVRVVDTLFKPEQHSICLFLGLLSYAISKRYSKGRLRYRT